MIELKKGDCLHLLQEIPNSSVNCILTDPPYLYLKGQKLEKEFDEVNFFRECKRVLKDDGFIVLFGRGTSFYRWNTILSDYGFHFKEEIIWNKSYCSSLLMAISRVHETISIHTKKSGTINKVKVPYLEMKEHDIKSVIMDVNRLKTTFKNTKSLDAVLQYLENNCAEANLQKSHKYNLSESNSTKNIDRNISVMQCVKNGMNEKSVIRTDFINEFGISNESTKCSKSCKDSIKEVAIVNSITQGMNEKSVIRTDMIAMDGKFYAATREGLNTGDRNVNTLYSIHEGMNEKDIILQPRDHYATIHPTQKPVRLLERLLALTTKEGDLVVDPFAGSASTGEACFNTNRNFVGYEIDSEYYQKATSRLASLKPNLFSLNPNLL